MKEGEKNAGRLSLVDWLILAAILFCGVWWARGFYFPDPWLAQGGAHGLHNLIILALKICSALLVLLIFVMYLAVRKGWIGIGGPAAGALGLVISLHLAYPLFSEFILGKTGALAPSKFHTYLQLTPQDFQLKEGDYKRIIALGGSTTAWPDSKGKKWTQYLEESLNSSCGEKGFSVYNQGRDWYTTLHSLINYSTNMRQAKPETVLIMHGINDMMHNADFNYLSNGRFRNDYGHYLGPAVRLINERTPLETVSYYFKRYWYFPERYSVKAAEFPGIAVFKQNLKTLIDLVRLDGARPVLMTEPYLYRETMTEEEINKLDMFRYEGVGERYYWTLDDVRRGMEQYSQAVREVAAEKGVLLIDLERAVPKDPQHFIDDVHYADMSFPLVASEISKGLTASGCSAASIEFFH